MAISPLKSGSNWNLEMLVFEERGKPEYLEKNLSSREENQEQTQPTYGIESENRSRAALVGGKCSHYYTIPAPQSLVIADGTLHVFLQNTAVCLKSVPTKLKNAMFTSNFTSCSITSSCIQDLAHNAQNIFVSVTIIMKYQDYNNILSVKF